MRTDPKRGDPLDDLDLVADLNAQDEDGLGWSTLADAHAPERLRPGAMRRGEPPDRQTSRDADVG